MSDTGPTEERSSSAGKRARGGSLGRRAGIAVFWLLAAYVIGMAALSMIPAVFFPGAAPLPPSRETESCAGPLTRLEHDLTARTAAHIVHQAPEPMAAWLSDWDRRYARLPARCGALQTARVSLARLREKLEPMLRRYDAELAPERRKLRKALDAIRPPE